MSGRKRDRNRKYQSGGMKKLREKSNKFIASQKEAMDKFAKRQCKSPDKVQNSDQDSRLTDELQQILE